MKAVTRVYNSVISAFRNVMIYAAVMLFTNKAFAETSDTWKDIGKTSSDNASGLANYIFPAICGIGGVGAVIVGAVKLIGGINSDRNEGKMKYVLMMIMGVIFIYLAYVILVSANSMGIDKSAKIDLNNSWN